MAPTLYRLSYEGTGVHCTVFIALYLQDCLHQGQDSSNQDRRICIHSPRISRQLSYCRYPLDTVPVQWSSVDSSCQVGRPRKITMMKCCRSQKKKRRPRDKFAGRNFTKGMKFLVSSKELQFYSSFL